MSKQSTETGSCSSSATVRRRRSAAVTILSRIRAPFTLSLAAACIAAGLLASVAGEAQATQQDVTATPAGATSARFASARELRLRTPGRVVAGDLLVAALTIRAGGGTRIYRPPGWTQLRRDSCAAGSVTLTQALYARVATTRQAAVTIWGLARATSAVGGIVAYRGLDPTRPIADVGGTARRNVARILAPSVTARTARALVVGVFGHSSVQADTLPAGSTSRIDVSTQRTPKGASLRVDHSTRARAGASGRRFAGLSGRAACSIGQQLALHPSSVTTRPGPPVNATLPEIEGTASVGQRLTATTGSWSDSPSTFAFRWRRCNSGGDACSEIPGADASSYLATAADAGSRLRVVVTAANAAGSAAAVSEPTAVVIGASVPGPAPAPVPVPIPGPPPPPPPSGSVVLVDRTWTCTGPVNIPLVRVTMRAGADAIHLREDCSGRIGRIEVDTWTLDGMKVNAPAPAAHDLVIEGGYIRCHDSEPNAHQDGIQAMGGSRIRFVGLELNCNSGPNAQLFIAAANGGRPTDIVCEGCFLGSGAGSSLFIATSTRSGARNTLICPGRFSPIRIQGADEPVNTANTVLPASDSRC